MRNLQQKTQERLEAVAPVGNFIEKETNSSSGCFWKMENCKADNIAENFFYINYWK